ncbi:MAG: carboxypeptidase regulatory-like domain-containing protein [Alphaproteobacteria bacterium]|nr:carboxypeptidase regulatory-like domain-containing protein [Alphaproteobacteria bacterium]
MRPGPFLLTLTLPLAAACDRSCDVNTDDGCGDEQVCANIEGEDEPACVAPVIVEGQVYDLLEGDAIEGARVIGVDPNGGPLSRVSTTDVDGLYSLRLRVDRDAEGAPLTQTFTLRGDASGYASFPGGLRIALPLSTADLSQVDGEWVLSSTLSELGLIALDEDAGQGSVRGVVEIPEGQVGALVVARGPDGARSALADVDGDYEIFNLSDGDWTVDAYAQGWIHSPASGSLSDGESVEVDIPVDRETASLLSGEVQIVNAPGGSTTSVILVVEDTFDETLQRGAMPPGLRAPDGAFGPTVSGAWSIPGVPPGDYIALAGFEDDGLVRDPDDSIGGTTLLRVSVGADESVDMGGFKVTEALAILSPSGDAPTVSATPTFSWEDDSSEDSYVIELVDALGRLTWETRIDGVSGRDPELSYDGPALESGMFYQLRVASEKDGSTLSTSQVTDGVFQVQ